MKSTIRLSIALLICCFTTAKSQINVEPDSSTLFLLESAREIILSSAFCGFITMDNNGWPHVRTMDPFAPEEDFTIWLATNPKSRKVEELKKNANVTLYYTGKNNEGYVTLFGRAQLVDDQKEKDKRWKEGWNEFYSNRTNAYTLIKISPVRLEVIHYAKGIFGDSVTWKPEEVVFLKD